MQRLVGDKVALKDSLEIGHLVILSLFEYFYLKGASIFGFPYA